MVEVTMVFRSREEIVSPKMAALLEQLDLAGKTVKVKPVLKAGVNPNDLGFDEYSDPNIFKEVGIWSEDGQKRLGSIPPEEYKKLYLDLPLAE